MTVNLYSCQEWEYNFSTFSPTLDVIRMLNVYQSNRSEMISSSDFTLYYSDYQDSRLFQLSHGIW